MQIDKCALKFKIQVINIHKYALHFMNMHEYAVKN